MRPLTAVIDLLLVAEGGAGEDEQADDSYHFSPGVLYKKCRVFPHDVACEVAMEASTVVVPGLSYLSAYLDSDEQTALLAIIDQQPWLSDLKRRVQHYGYHYNYVRRSVDSMSYLGPLPDWAARLARRLTEDQGMEHVPDQVIVNEYLPGQGVSSHIDCIPCFGPTVVSISLGSACVMLFTHATEGTQVPILVEAGSLVVMSGDARFRWKHSIPARKADVVGERKIVRGRRVSLTFRTVL